MKQIISILCTLPFVASAQLVKLEGAKVNQYKQVGDTKPARV